MRLPPPWRATAPRRMLATTVTAPIEETCQSLEGIARYIRNHEKPEETPRLAAEILGMHLEGPFISKVRPGVHPLESIAKPSVEILEQFLKAADGLVRIVTIAPEIPGARRADSRRRGCRRGGRDGPHGRDLRASAGRDSRPAFATRCIRSTRCGPFRIAIRACWPRS